MVQYNPDAEKERFKQLLDAAQDELLDAVTQRNSLEFRIRKLHDDIVHLAALCGEQAEDPIKDLGLTDAIRYVLSHAKEGPVKLLTPIDIKAALSARGLDVSQYSNVMASIHTVLRRLQRKGEILPSRFRGGSYIWTGRGLTPPPPLPDWLKEKLKK